MDYNGVDTKLCAACSPLRYPNNPHQPLVLGGITLKRTTCELVGWHAMPGAGLFRLVNTHELAHARVYFVHNMRVARIYNICIADADTLFSGLICVRACVLRVYLYVWACVCA